MNMIILYAVLSAIAAGKVVSDIIFAVSLNAESRKYKERIPIKKYSPQYSWVITFAVLNVLNALISVYGLRWDNHFEEIVFSSVKIVCYTLIVIMCISQLLINTRAYITEGGVICFGKFFPQKSVKYSIKRTGGDMIIHLYSEKSRNDIKFTMKSNDKVVEMTGKLYDEFDGKAEDCHGKSRAWNNIILFSMMFVFVGGLFTWYGITKPVIFIGNSVIKTDSEYAILSNLGFINLRIGYDAKYFPEFDSEYKIFYNSIDCDTLTSKDLTVLKQMPNLRYVDVTRNNIDDITTIGELTQLEGLAFGGGDKLIKPKDYSPLKNLSNIKYFEGLGLYELNDLTIFENLDKLEYFELTGADIQTGLDVICEKENLVDLNLFRCTAEDFSPIGKCDKLKILYLSETNVTDLSFLKDLSELEHLDIDNVKAEDYSPLLELPMLNKLCAENTDIPNYIVNKLAAKGVDVQR